MICKSKFLKKDERLFKILNIENQKIIYEKVITN